MNYRIHNTFDPWSATLEDWTVYLRDDCDVKALYESWCSYRRVAGAPSDPKEWTGRDVVQGVADCARFGLVIPEWLALKYIRRFNAVRHYRAASWDEPLAFGKAHPTIARDRPTRPQLAAMHKRRYGYLLEKLFGEGKLKRTPEGFAAAADMYGLTIKQVRTYLPKTRTNKRGTQADEAKEKAHLDIASKAFFALRENVPKRR